MIADYRLWREDTRRYFRSYTDEYGVPEDFALEVREAMGYHYLRMIFERVRILMQRLVLRRRLSR